MLHNFRPAYLDDSGYDAPSHLQACISILLMENIMEVHNFSIFILRFFSILISALIEKKRKCIWRKYPLFSPLSAIKSGVSILPIIWRKNGTEYGENFHFFLRFFSIMIFPFFSPLSAIKSGVSILPSIRFSAFRIWRIYGDLRYGLCWWLEWNQTQDHLMTRGLSAYTVETPYNTASYITAWFQYSTIGS